MQRVGEWRMSDVRTVDASVRSKWSEEQGEVSKTNVMGKHGIACRGITKLRTQ